VWVRRRGGECPRRGQTAGQPRDPRRGWCRGSRGDRGIDQRGSVRGPKPSHLGSCVSDRVVSLVGPVFSRDDAEVDI
jgi:hypothetical protein